MDRIFKRTVKETLRNKQYWVSLLIITIISSNAIINIVKTYRSIPTADFLILFYHFMLSIFIFALIIPIVLAIAVLPEKTSGRCEYYLANNVKLPDLINSYYKSLMILSLLPVALYYIIINLYFIVQDINIIFRLTLNWGVLLFIISLLIFSYIVSRYLVILSMTAKKPDSIRTVLTIFSIVSIYIIVFPMDYLSNKGIVFGYRNTIIYYLSILSFLDIVCWILILNLNKKLDNERIILSYKE